MANTAVKKKTASAKPKKSGAAKKIKTYTISKKNLKGYSAKDLAYFKALILEKRKEILEELSILKESMMDVTTGEYSSENSMYSTHMEQGTDAMEREKTFLFASREGKFLNYLDDALRRIDKGTYGFCLDCIEEPKGYCRTCPLIPKERLEAVPHAQLCVECKNLKQKY